MGPIEIRIYRGADGQFDLYEDAGDGSVYQRGQHSVIPFRWDDRRSALTIGAREGSFPGMVEHRTFRVVLIDNNHGVGAEVAGAANAEIAYDGKEIRVVIR